MLFAWLAHLYTASGLLLAFLAALAVISHDYRAAFFWLAVQVVVDATDGVLARAARVSDRLPWFNGAKLDDIVDYLTYVFVPALIVWSAALVPSRLTLPVAGAMLVASGYGFNRSDAKTDDHFFTGFPSYWNIVVLYLMVLGWPAWLNTGVLLGLAILVFVPLRYVYPSRMTVLRVPTNVLGALWGVLMLWMIWQFPDVSSGVVAASLVFPAYYFALSLALSRAKSFKNRPNLTSL